MKITAFKELKDVSVPYIKTVDWAINRIKLGKSKEQIEEIRKEKDKKKRDELKSKLTSYLFAGEFQKRSKSGIVSFSGLISLDFDKFKTFKDAKDFKETLKEVPYTFLAFISPSGNGVKAVFKIPQDDLEGYKQYFDAIKQFFSMPEFDKGVSDFSRVCYESYDTDIYVNYDSEIWTQKEVIELEELGCSNPSIAVTSENRIITILLTWFNKHYSMADGQRNVNLFKLAASFNDFGVNQSEALNVCLQYEVADFTELEIKAIVTSAYKAVHKFGTKFFEDKGTRDIIEKKIREGEDDTNIYEEFGSFERGEIKKIVTSIRKEITVDDFWDHTKNGGIVVSPHKYKYWLQSNGFFKFFPESGTGFTFVRKEQNLLILTDETKIKDFVLNYLIGRHDIGYLPYDFMASSTKLFTGEFLKLLDTIELDIKKDTKDNCFLYYLNCVVSISKDGIELLDYVDVDGFIWKDQIIDREFESIEGESEFKKFVELLANKEEKRFNSLRSVIGYLCHNHKTSAHNRAIIINDETISENPNGGSGKGLFTQGIGKVRKLASIDGKNFSFEKSFPYQTVKVDTQIMAFDDVKRNFIFENLFSLITEGITLEYKGKDAIKLPVEKSPKILITTNYTIGGVGGSFERRKFEVEFSEHFSYKHTPLDEFGRMLFDDWDLKEWKLFDNFMVDCTKFYLENGLIKHEYNNLETRKFTQETSYEFYEWTNEGNLPVNTRIIKSEYFEAICLEYPDLKKYLTQKRFSAWLEVYAKLKNFRIIKGRTHSSSWVEFEDLDSEKEEDFNSLVETENAPF